MTNAPTVTATYPADYDCPSCGKSKAELEALGQFTLAIAVAGAIAACFNCVYRAAIAAGFEDD
jgi:transcription elongation factor Elf1